MVDISLPGTLVHSEILISTRAPSPLTPIPAGRTYLTQTMILRYDTDVREKNEQAWEKLKAAWKATFHTELTAGPLKKWPTDGPHGFSEEQSTWLAATLHYLKGQGKAPARRRGSAPPPRRSGGLLRPGRQTCYKDFQKSRS
jgi:hypothetical protein